MPPKILNAITRRKRKYDQPPEQLARVMNLMDLIAFGVGSALGLGVYVLAGQMAKSTAGPATCLSFLVAAVISLFAAMVIESRDTLYNKCYKAFFSLRGQTLGFCYAEVSARVPRAGFAYMYTYISIGEFVAFIIGWNIIVGSMIGAASVASAISKHVDAMFDGKMENALAEWMPIHVAYVSPFPDFLAAGIILFFTILLSSGMRDSKIFNNICTTLNVATMLIAITACLTKVDFNNWKISINNIDKKYRNGAGDGGFFPFGLAGVISAVPNCFFGFTGFDSPAMSSEEAKRPKKDIPLAILIALLITFLAYFTISSVLTLAWPYYLQSEDAAFPHVFDELGWTSLKWVVTIGSICALSTSLFGSMYAMPRIMYAMANDGLIFKALAKVHPKTKTPIFATVSSGLVSGFIAAFVDLNQLVDFSTIGCLLGYSVVAVSLLVFRYQVQEEKAVPIDLKEIISAKNVFQKLFNFIKDTTPTKITSKIANWTIALFIAVSTLFCLTLAHGSHILPGILYYFCLTSTIIGMIILVYIMSRQPEYSAELYFKVPFSPFIPCLSVLFNIYLMAELSSTTWIGFIVWLIIGSLVYFTYGIRHSKENFE